MTLRTNMRPFQDLRMHTYADSFLLLEIHFTWLLHQLICKEYQSNAPGNVKLPLSLNSLQPTSLNSQALTVTSHWILIRVSLNEPHLASTTAALSANLYPSVPGINQLFRSELAPTDKYKGGNNTMYKGILFSEPILCRKRPAFRLMSKGDWYPRPERKV